MARVSRRHDVYRCSRAWFVRAILPFDSPSILGLDQVPIDQEDAYPAACNSLLVVDIPGWLAGWLARHLVANKHACMRVHLSIISALIMHMLPKNIAMEIVIMECWSTWMVRNDNFFRMAVPLLNSWKHYLKEWL